MASAASLRKTEDGNLKRELIGKCKEASAKIAKLKGEFSVMRGANPRSASYKDWEGQKELI